MGGTVINQHVTKYRPPFDEFEIDHCVLPEGMDEPLTLQIVPGPSIFLVVKGRAILEVGRSRRRHFVAEGHVFLLLQTPKVLYRAGVNSKFLQASQV
ncbi:hypothetical protein K1719_000587 [Acacia pycnantha]|nr:hypothetical protein K1719_000587 [Acacia pycnantha]